jgi:hypothetical protein
VLRGKGTALGLGASGDVSDPTHVASLTEGVVSVACGDIHAAALTGTTPRLRRTAPTHYAAAYPLIH